LLKIVGFWGLLEKEVAQVIFIGFTISRNKFCHLKMQNPILTFCLRHALVLPGSK
jgi:hypothetical protein